MMDLCIIGAGACGMSAAIIAKRNNPNLNITILEKKEKPGKKIIASGNGKCNLSNIKCSKFEEVIGFFNSIGVITRTDAEGRIYPYTEESKAVANALETELNKLGVDLQCGESVSKVEKKTVFIITTEEGKTFEAKKLLICCGGKAAPKLGTTGDGYKWAKSLGHSVTKLVPVLTAINLKEDTKDFAGIRAKARVSLYYKDAEIFAEDGEIQFTKDGISGICVFNMSRFMIIPKDSSIKEGFDDYKIEIDFLPREAQAMNLISYRKDVLGLSENQLLDCIVRKPIGDKILQLSKGDIIHMAELINHFTLHPCGAKGWDFAQVTKGGIEIDEINLNTMESKICPDLFFGGEIIDFDGPCGGFNLQNAWETGIKAGRTIGNV